MNINDKQHIASIARKLIQTFEYCDDDKFIDLIVECVRDANHYPIYPEYLCGD